MADPKNAACYKARYADVTGDASYHYMSTGEKEGRLFTCGKNMTYLEAESYLWTYPSLQIEFGGSYGFKYYNEARDQFLS